MMHSEAMIARSALILALFAACVGPALSAEPEVMAHLASYRSKAGAEKGWRVMAETYSSVLYFEPEVLRIEIVEKGEFFRLYAAGDQELVRMLCGSLNERSLYCALHRRDAVLG